MVFFSENSRVSVATDAGSARTRSRSSASPVCSPGSTRARWSVASGDEESTTVPEGSTITIDSTVR